MAYHTSTCDVYFAGDGSRVSRLNLEQGRFLNPYQMDSTGSNVIEMNKEHQLVSIGTTDGKVEAWDPRSRQRVGILDCVADMGCKEQDGIPEITALAFRDALNMGVGTSTGKVLLYDIRSSKAILTKDHLYDLPIKKVVFHSTLDQVLSMDGKVVKIWDRQTGKAYASIESDHDMNDLAVYPGSGLMFMANEQPKLQVHYIPSLGPAPRWCSFLDNLTEELEESAVTEVYDDYKFVTKEQIDDLGLDHLIGSSLLRAYMHGYFMDARLYRKAQGLVEPFNAEKFKEDKIKKKLEEKQEKRVQLTPKNKLPKVNKDLFIKLKDREANPIQKKKKGKADDASAKLLEDDRFKDMFSDDRFAVDTNEEAYKLLNPVLSRLDEKTKKKYEAQEVEKSDEDSASEMSEDPVDSDIESHDESSSEEEEVVQRKDKKKKPLTTDKKTVSLPQPSGEIGFYELKEGVSATGAIDRKLAKKNKASLESRIRDAEESGPVIRRDGVMSMTFKSKKSKTQIKEALANKKHIQERIAVRRSVGMLKNKNKKDYS